MSRSPVGHGRSVDVHRSTTLTAQDVSVENRIPCTTVARTVLDLAAVTARRIVERVNRWIDLGDGEPMIRGDFVWCEQGVIVEADGGHFHGTTQARERDPRRDQRAILAGWRPVRTTWGQVIRRPRELEPALLRLVASPPPAAPN